MLTTGLAWLCASTVRKDAAAAAAPVAFRRSRRSSWVITVPRPPKENPQEALARCQGFGAIRARLGTGSRPVLSTAGSIRISTEIADFTVPKQRPLVRSACASRPWLRNGSDNLARAHPAHFGRGSADDGACPRGLRRRNLTETTLPLYLLVKTRITWGRRVPHGPLVAKRHCLSGLSAFVSRFEPRRNWRPERHRGAARLSCRTGRGCGVDLADLSLADGGLRLRRLGLYQHRSDVRNAQRFRRAGRGGAFTRAEDHPGFRAQPHVRSAPLVRREPVVASECQA